MMMILSTLSNAMQTVPSLVILAMMGILHLRHVVIQKISANQNLGIAQAHCSPVSQQLAVLQMERHVLMLLTLHYWSVVTGQQPVLTVKTVLQQGRLVTPLDKGVIHHSSVPAAT